MKPGKFITLEGGEGVGKSTNLVFIKEYLESHNISVVVSREPGGTLIAEKIRDLLLQKNPESLTEQAEILMVFAARAQHLYHVIKPALNSGKWVLCDRFTDATYAYQGGGRNMDLKMISWLENTIQGELRPDLTLLLDAPVDIGLNRARERGELDRFESEQKVFFEKVRSAYLEIANQQPERVKVINTDQNLSAVQEELINNISPLL